MLRPAAPLRVRQGQDGARRAPAGAHYVPHAEEAPGPGRTQAVLPASTTQLRRTATTTATATSPTTTTTVASKTKWLYERQDGKAPAAGDRVVARA